MLKYTIELLNENSVSIKTITINENGETIGEPHRRAYLNDEKERAELIEDLPEYIQNAVFAVWDANNT
ncbi:hypothetical protein [Gracilibacillus dipsosauri]|uniref:hypothetical protein n=1 Tax=Gracilibacillus dipsosauri TaxID=178340 RepID=UPI00240A52F5